MCRAAEAIRAGVRAAAIAVDGIIEADIGAVVVRDDRARLGLLKDFNARFRRLADPFDCVREPGIGRVFDVAHVDLRPSTKAFSLLAGICEQRLGIAFGLTETCFILFGNSNQET